jgi:Ser/Thr protein kinase RdoA (MazF antagonist)
MSGEHGPGTHPFDALTPERVLDAVERLGVPCDGRLFALNSFENRVYQVGREGAEPVIAKFYRPGRWSDAEILEEHAFLAELAAAELPVAAPLADGQGRTLSTMALDLEGDGVLPCRVALFPRLAGRSPDLESSEHLEWLGRLVARLHLIGARQPFRTRPRLSVERLGDTALADTLAGALLPDGLRGRYERSVRALLGRVRGAIAANPARQLRLHGDLHRGNLLWGEAGPLFVDFDDCLTGPAIQDLWMLLPGDEEERRSAVGDLVAGYETFRPFDWSELALIEPLRALRMVHHAGWLSARFDDPAFPRAFPYAAQARFWEEQLMALEEMGAGM